MAILKTAMTLGAAGLLAAPLLVAVAALSGIGHRWPDILAQFTVPAFSATVVVVVLCLVLRLPWAAGAGAVVAGLLLIAVWPQWAPGGPRPDLEEPRLTLYSANLWARNEDVDAIARSITAADADIVVLIELGDVPAAKAEMLLAAYPHRVASRRLDRPTGAERMVIASRYPLTQRSLPKNGLAAIAARAETPLGPVEVIGVHMTRPWPFVPQWGQISQVMRLDEAVQGRTAPVIVAGDFNSVSSARIGRQVKAIGLTPAGGWPGTWPSVLPAPFRVTIDQVYGSPELAIVERRLGAPTGSDHRPVITTFSRVGR
jgi:endonuclease/exonuclease/phosphatase (EEP) superfamily protein YafD